MKNICKYVSCLLVSGLVIVGYSLGGIALAANENPCEMSNPPEYCNVATDEDPATETIRKVTSIISWAAGVIAIFWIIIMGIKMQTSYGNAEKVKSARMGIIYAIVGLVVVIVARLLVLAVMKIIS